MVGEAVDTFLSPFFFLQTSSEALVPVDLPEYASTWGEHKCFWDPGTVPPRAAFERNQSSFLCATLGASVSAGPQTVLDSDEPGRKGLYGLQCRGLLVRKSGTGWIGGESVRVLSRASVCISV